VQRGVGRHGSGGRGRGCAGSAAVGLGTGRQHRRRRCTAVHEHSACKPGTRAGRRRAGGRASLDAYERPQRLLQLTLQPRLAEGRHGGGRRQRATPSGSPVARGGAVRAGLRIQPGTLGGGAFGAGLAVAVLRNAGPAVAALAVGGPPAQQACERQVWAGVRGTGWWSDAGAALSRRCTNPGSGSQRAGAHHPAHPPAPPQTRRRCAIGG
jgi:hypothetical protein